MQEILCSCCKKKSGIYTINEIKKLGWKKRCVQYNNQEVTFFFCSKKCLNQFNYDFRSKQ